MATIYRPRNSVGRETPDRWRGNHVRRNGMLNLRMQPAIGYEHHRGSVIGFVLLTGLVLLLTLGLIQLFTPSSTQMMQTHPLALTPVVTVQILSAATAAPVMANVPLDNQPSDVSDAPVLMTVSTDTGFVDVRSGPGAGYDPLGTLPAGQTAALIGRSANGQWWLISFQGRIGWVDASFARFDGDLSQVPVAAAQ